MQGQHISKWRKFVAAASSVVTIIGLSGLPDAIAKWGNMAKALADVINQDFLRWIIALIALGVALWASGVLWQAWERISTLFRGRDKANKPSPDGDSAMALQIQEWFALAGTIWRALYTTPILGDATSSIEFFRLCAELREKTAPLAANAETRGISSEPFHRLTGNIEGATEQVWNDAWTIAKRLRSIADGVHGK